MHLFRLNDTTTASFCLSNENVFAGDLRLLLVGILGTLVSIVCWLLNWHINNLIEL